MLNRTNLTLSALSNRLNLGTRSLVLNTSVDNGKALHIRHAHHDVMREPMAAFSFVGVPCVPAYVTPPITGAGTGLQGPKWGFAFGRRPSCLGHASVRKRWSGWASDTTF